MKSLRDRILGISGPRIVKLDQLGIEGVCVRGLTGTERDAVEEMLRDNKEAFSSRGWRGRMAAMYLCNEKGERVFDPTADAVALNEFPVAVLDTIIEAGHEAGLFGAKGVEEAKGN